MTERAYADDEVSPGVSKAIKILTFVEHYLPGFRSGGPVRTIANMVERLGRDFEFLVVTSDRDALENRPYEDVIVNQWNDVAGAKVYYAAPGSRSLLHLVRLIKSTDHDVVYLNSFFSRTSTLLPLLAQRLLGTAGKPVVLAPRGEFSPGALDLKSFKKKSYLALARGLGLYRNITWHASSPIEEEYIRATVAGSAATVVVAPNLAGKAVALPPERSARGERGERLQIVFLSRVTKKKNLHFALEVLGSAGVPASLSIVGVIDDEAYWKSCQQVIEKLPGHVSVTYKGVVPHVEVGHVLAEHDLFFLPTLGENFGHAILESLASGTPVLISDQTPWSDLDQAGVGWVRPLGDVQGFVNVIRHVAGQSEVEAAQRRVMATGYASKIKEDRSVLLANQSLFERVSAGETSTK